MTNIKEERAAVDSSDDSADSLEQATDDLIQQNSSNSMISRIQSQMLSQLYKNNQFGKMVNVKDEKLANRFYALDTDFIDMFNLNTTNILLDINSLNDKVPVVSDSFFLEGSLERKLEEGNIYSKAVNFDKSEFKHLDL